MIRAVLDTGVLIAAVLSANGAPAELLRLWLDGVFEIVVSEKLLSELDRVLRRSKFRPYLSLREVERYLDLLSRWAEHASDGPADRNYTSDPNDDYLVALAISAEADFLVSGDKHLLGVDHSVVPVLSPRQALEFLDKLNRRS
jgi:putative PIN family toxin of toxin-antitoxin system